MTKLNRAQRASLVGLTHSWKADIELTWAPDMFVVTVRNVEDDRLYWIGLDGKVTKQR